MTTGFLQRDRAAHPPALAPGYKTTVLRSPRAALVSFETGPAERRGPAFGDADIGPDDHDLIVNYARALGLEGEAIGERVIVHGRVVDQRGRPIPGCLIEVWQANAGGRYRHKKDGYLAALDPNFGGCGRVLTGEDGAFAFRTIRPGPYPWPNAGSEWRPAHIHLSIFGEAFAQRLITQLYFEGDPLIRHCPILNAIPDATVADRLVARLDLDEQAPFDALAYRFDIVLRGRRQSYFESQPEGL